MKDPLVFDRNRKHPAPSPPDAERRLCRWCRGPIKARNNSSWCSTECAEEGAIRSNQSYARFKVEERDKGVCAKCCMDTRYVKSLLDPLLKEAANRWREPWVGEELRNIVFRALIDLGFSPRVASGGAGHRWAGVLNTHLWEMDHTTPVVEGGGGVGLEGLRTLCRACHHRETTALAGRRAKTMRLQKKERRHRNRMRLKQRRLW